MSFFSDGTIRRYLAQGLLVVGGDPAMAEHNSYQFRPGKIFHPGADGRVVDWSGPGGGSEPPEIKVEPGHLVWIRVREQVKLPPDVCAFWWQTNSLSRQGLMLVNMSMVEPGYEGPLACLFVNFGSAPVVIDRGVTVAKLIFASLDRPAERPFRHSGSLESYDRAIRNVALTGPTSFLQVSELEANLAQERHRALMEIEARAQEQMWALEAREGELGRSLADATADSIRTLKNTTDEWNRKTLNELQADLRGTVVKWFGIPFGLLSLVVLVVNFLPPYRVLFRPNLDQEIRKAVAEEVARRIVVPGVPVADTAPPDSLPGRSRPRGTRGGK